ARCASLAIAWLVAASEKRKVARGSSKLNLETGLIALAGKMISHKLYSLAVNELCSVKRQFEKGSHEVLKSGSSQSIRKPSSETASALWDVQVDFEAHQELLPLAIAYQTHLLKIIAGLGSPHLISASLQHLLRSFRNSPGRLVSQSHKLAPLCTETTAKLAKQLEIFSTLIWSMAPSASSINDTQATDDTLSPCPSTAFQLQCLALDFRRQWWQLADHRADAEKELAEPFARCVAAFIRRTQNVLSAADQFTMVSNATQSLGVVDVNGDSRFGVVRAVCLLACETASKAKIHTWLKMLSKSCAHLGTHNAKRIAVECRTIWVSLQDFGELKSARKSLVAIRDSLSSQLSGTSSDYAWLIQELAGLGRSLTKLLADDSELIAEVLKLSARFAQHFAQSYTDRCHVEVQEIIVHAISCGPISGQSLDWVALEATRAFIHGGAIRDISIRAKSMNIVEAFTASPAALAFSKLLESVMLKAIRSGDVDSTLWTTLAAHLEQDQEACILHWQLKYSLELSEKSKYHQALQKIVPRILQRLAKALPACEFPLRRLVIALLVHNLCDVHPAFVPDRISQIWSNTPLVDKEHMGRDHRLVHFVDDVNASMRLARSFSEGEVKSSELSACLDFWKAHCKPWRDNIRTYDSEVLCFQISSLASYCSAIGEIQTCHEALTILLQLYISRKDEMHVFDCLASLCRVSLLLLRSDSAKEYLEQARDLMTADIVNDLAMLQHCITRAQYELSCSKLDETKASLAKAQEIRAQVDVRQLQRHQRKLFERLHADVWLLYSEYLLKSGMAHQALAAGKCSMKLYAGIWASAEKRAEATDALPLHEDEDIDKQTVDGLTVGVSKLNFKDALQRCREPGHHSKSNKGAAFWWLIPGICHSLGHLSRLYIHHGLFHEADYYSKRSLALCESIHPSKRLAELYAHRCTFMALAGNLEEAELCLEKAKGVDLNNDCIAEHFILQAEAALRDAEGSISDAVAIYGKCEELLDNIEKRYLKTPSIQATPCPSTDEAALLRPKSSSAKQKSASNLRSTNIRTTKSKAVGTRKQPQAPGNSLVPTVEHDRKPDTLIEKLRMESRDTSAILQLRQGILNPVDVSVSLPELDEATTQRHMRYETFISRAMMLLQSDVSLGVILESSLALPGIEAIGSKRSTTIRRVKASNKSKQASGQDDSLISLLDSAWRSLNNQENRSDSSTINCHNESSMLSNISLLRSTLESKNDLDLYKFAHELEYARSHALECERHAASTESHGNSKADVLAWPDLNSGQMDEGLDVKSFQQTYVDIIPEPWTTVSMSLSIKGDELCVARYRSGEQPFFLRLPFGRQKGDEDGAVQQFDYHTAKSELEDIIQLSNYSCHNYGDLSKKGAKTDWWENRESLDHRIEELLVNMQNIWFGGFQGVLSATRAQGDLLQRFRQSFESILNRNLPSRAKMKSSSKGLRIADNILELFTSLDVDAFDNVDIDDHLTDLLYLVVDTLQFGGEPNAYDEIDFDSMTVEILDAIRDYRSPVDIDTNPEQHLILILDRKLQRFPWENLPCLQNISTSRVGSMQSLRECILAMNSMTRHDVNDGNGTYILNPSGDLKSTQQILEPVLSKLSASRASQWRALINQVPSEGTMSDALTTSSINLYFGHGGGSQYIRPRAVKKLERCSEVIWLMGCSSGAVTEYGELEPFAIPYSYLMAGTCTDSETSKPRNPTQSGGKCLSVLATLWDVTDRDIDRFSIAVGEEWGLWAPASQTKPGIAVSAKTPARKQRRAETPSTPVQVPKTPKTPKVRKISATKTPVESLVRSRSHEPGTWSLPAAVNRSRDACYLRYLNGAAPVMYGIPVYL
ncbi:hypothetical protein K431DRAFT_198514, partial [Polychaeton citri CBS 116435]